MKEYYVYIMSNKTNSTLYIGVTNDIIRRAEEHKNGVVDGFSNKYNTHKLVYYEQTNDVDSAIAREKQLKGWIRAKKEKLINAKNPEWKDLSEEFM